MIDHTKEILLEVGDGPEGITIYTSEEEAIVDWADHVPALYIQASLNGAYVKLGPFMLKSVRDEVVRKLKGE